MKENIKDLEQLETENKELKQKLNYYSGLLQNQNDAVIIHDLQGEIIAWDKGAETIFGWKQEELLSTSIYDIIPKNRQKEYNAFIANIHKNKDNDFFETQKIAKDGKIRDVWLTYKLLGEDEPYAIATTERDITERKKAAEQIRKSEEKYQILINSLGDGVLLLNYNFDVLLTNPAAEKILFLSRDRQPDLNLKVFLDDKNLEIFQNHFDNLETETQTFEIEMVRVDEEKRLVQVTLSTPINKLDKAGNTLCILKDITDIKHMEDELIKADKLESLGLLAGGIAHDFNNILSIINGNITLARMALHDDEKLKERLDRIATANDRAKQLTQQISTLSKGHSVTKAQLSINRLINECANLSLKTKKIDYNLNIQDNLPTILADEGQLSQVINNLFINASHAVTQETGLIQVDVRETRLAADNKYAISAGNYVKIVVTDNGVGIPKANLKKIFDPYFTTKSHGTGLGLSTSISIINKHNGKMTVDSEVGKGTTFHILLPFTEKDRKSKEDKHFTVNGKVLFMDDEDTILSIAELFFQKLNYKVALTKTGEEALEMYKNQYEKETPFDYVFLDLNIPSGMDGFECAQEILKINSEAKIIAVSGNLILSKYKEHGFVKAMKKPFRITNLQTILKELSKDKTIEE